MRAPVIAARVLIVESDSGALARATALLHAHDCAVTVAPSIAAALAVAPTLQPDVVMLPLVGTGVEGYEACRRLHGDPATRRGSIALVAEDGAVVDHVWARLQGARTVLCKPYTSDTIQEMLQACARFR